MIEKKAIADFVAKLDSSSGNDELRRKLHALVTIPRRRRIVVNLDEINRRSRDGESVLVPGKILGIGSVRKKLKICAVEYSKGVVEKLKGSKCEMVDVNAILKESNVRVML